MDFSVFENSINIIFKDKDLLRQAFTHRSYLNEHKGSKMEHNERLEFLGDAVLELAVTDFLYKKFSRKSEGELTAYRSALVNSTTLATVAEKLNMNAFLLLSKGESKDTGRARQFILANTFESVLGAIYLDQGYAVADTFISNHLSPLLDDIVQNKSFIDAKSQFQERSQEKVGITPAYKLVKESGPDHGKVFTVGVYLDEDLISTGDGKSKQDAEQEAAKKALIAKGW
ncbi:MAG: ribonuclease III [bacterium]